MPDKKNHSAPSRRPRVAIIGAGPAGIYTARLLRDFPGDLHLFEAGEKIGAKLRLTGGGRMNLGNRHFGASAFQSEQPRLLANFFKSPRAKNWEEVFRELGTEWKYEGDRAVLASEDADAEVERLARALRDQVNLRVRLSTRVERAGMEGAKFRLEFARSNVGSGNATPPEKPDTAKCYNARPDPEIYDAVVVAGGGRFRLAEKRAGGADEIYALPLQLGHAITVTTPSLSPLVLDPPLFSGLSGLSIRARLTDPATGRSATDDLLFTHRGLSGPAALDFSALASGPAGELCFLPDADEDEFAKKLSSARKGRVVLRTLLRDGLPRGLADWLLDHLKIPEGQVVATLKGEDEKRVRENLFRFRLPRFAKMDYPSCWTTRGGVDLRGVSMATLESKLRPGLYFAGEILDISGLCGGFNLSFAAVSARVVADALLKGK